MNLGIAFICVDFMKIIPPHKVLGQGLDKNLNFASMNPRKNINKNNNNNKVLEIID